MAPHLYPDPYENEQRQIADAELKAEDVPAPHCDEAEIHRFALSIDGYAREGNMTKCARLADDAHRRWGQTGELSHDLRALRSCLFYEQRRAYHTGYGFGDIDPRTLAYVRGLVEAIRARVRRPDAYR
jgi:hypothetical protein